MWTHHLSLIFCFVINIVIFTSGASAVRFEERFEDEASEPLENELKLEKEASDEDAELMPRGTNFYQSGPFKYRRDSPAGYEQETNNNEAVDGEGDSFGDDDAKIRYILDRMQARDVGQTAAVKPPTDTFNGKLIPCFIHRGLFPLPSHSYSLSFRLLR